MKIAIVGSGISGLVAARGLCAEHEVSVFEAAERIGGHTHTLDVEEGGRKLAIDTGFIVFNRRTYPGFCALLDELGVASRPSDMSFSVRSEQTGCEYNGTSLDGLFAQRTNALRPSFWRMLRDILRFYREAPAVLERDEDDTTLGAFLARGGYSRRFVDEHLVPMAAAVWSSAPERAADIPLRFLLRFFHNHGFLQTDGRPTWLVVQGGSRAYLGPLCAPFAERIRCSTPVVRVERIPGGVRLFPARGEPEEFERVVLATHSDQSLRLLADATRAEREVLGALDYQRNVALLHTDASLMPRRRRAWASWNYHVSDPPALLPTVTYWMNRLQGLAAERDYFVSLNRAADVDPACILRRIVYHHPLFTCAALRAQARHAEIDGTGGVHYCGAYWGFGFHEDGLQSAQRVVRSLSQAVAV